MRSAVRVGRVGTLPSAYFAAPAGTFAFSSSNQFWIRLMCVTGGRVDLWPPSMDTCSDGPRQVRARIPAPVCGAYLRVESIRISVASIVAPSTRK